MVPVTASITASFMSALTLLGIPAEVYTQVLCCTVLNCAVLYCTVLYCTVLYCTVDCTVLNCAVL